MHQTSNQGDSMMLTTRKKNIFFIVLTLVSCAAMVLMCGPACAKNVKVPIGLNLELTGGLAATTLPVSYGLLDYIKYINDEGGFEYKANGKTYKAKYDIIWADNGFSVARSMTNVRRFAGRGAKVILTA
jgi:hypothetical protein